LTFDGNLSIFFSVFNRNYDIPNESLFQQRMPEKRERGRKRPKRYNLLLMPEGESGRSRSYNVTPIGVILGAIGAVFSVVIVLLVLLIYTPVGKIISIPNPELERRYMSELIDVQEKLSSVSDDVAFMREYNLQLRRALGEDVGETGTGSEPIFTGQTQNIEPTNRVVQAATRTEEPVPYNTEFDEIDFLSGPVQLDRDTDVGSRPSLPMLLPADGYITRRYEVERGHIGIDIAGKVNTPIGAVSDGTVIFSNWTYQDGNMVILSHGSGYFSVYKHNQTNLVRPGALVRRGETIALLGNTGAQSYGPHLHFELWKDGVPLDPSFYLFDFKDTL
jgi:murein DD-endopeptidase MepM/ murein hydrolase activator NlpD